MNSNQSAQEYLPLQAAVQVGVCFKLRPNVISKKIWIATQFQPVGQLNLRTFEPAMSRQIEVCQPFVLHLAFIFYTLTKHFHQSLS